MSVSGSVSGEIYKQYVFAQPGNKEGVCSWAAKGGWADTVSNRISQIIKITLPLIPSDPDSSLFISTVPGWGCNNAGRCQMLEAGRRQEEGIFTKYQGYSVWKGITPLKGELPSWQCWNLPNSPRFYTDPAQDFAGDFKGLCCIESMHFISVNEHPPSPKNRLAERCSSAQSYPCCTFKSNDLTPLSFVRFYFFYQPC